MLRATLLATAAVLLAGSAWLYWRSPANIPSANAPLPPESQAPTLAADAGRVQAPAQRPSAASAASSAPPLLPLDEAPAELLRKVQLGLGGGSPQEVLAAAYTLQFCAHAAKAAGAMFIARDAKPLLPPAIQKIMDSFGGITNEQIERAQRDERRCQVFDDATLARRGELFQKAYEGGAEGAAMAYLHWLTYNGPKDETDPALMHRLQTDVRRSAETGDIATLISFAYTVDARPLGASPTERQAYKEALFRILDDSQPGNSSASRELIAKLEQLSPLAPLTAEQQREADALTQQVVEAYRRRKKG